jgi:hypothetical protein
MLGLYAIRFSFLDDFKQCRLHVTGGFETTEVDECCGHVCKAGVWKVLSETNVFGQSRPANGHRHLRDDRTGTSISEQLYFFRCSSGEPANVHSDRGLTAFVCQIRKRQQWYAALIHIPIAGAGAQCDLSTCSQEALSSKMRGT